MTEGPSICALQWVLCVRCTGSIEAVWSICPCIDQEEMLLTEVHPWRQHHPGLHGKRRLDFPTQRRVC